MATRLPSLLEPALLFAHRGARANAQEHSLEAFALALRLGATGIHVDAWATRDGAVVLDRDGLVRRFPKKRMADVDVDDLPEGVVRIQSLYAALGARVPLSVRLGDEAALPGLLVAARACGAAEQLWLAHEDIEVLGRWRDIAPEVQLVNEISLSGLDFGPERRAAELAAARVDAVRLPEDDWTGGLVTLFHRFAVLAFADGAHFERQLARLIDMGIDAVTGDHVERMAAVAATFE